jgi:hypothetical protein
MEFQLKRLSRESIQRALEKAERYRLLNEPAEAESICLDILQAEPDNQKALVTLLLASTDRLGKGYAVGATQAKDVLPRLRDPYEKAYYAGVICERRAKTRLQQGVPGSRFDAYELFREAMAWYEKAESIRPPGNDDALLRWNTCARILMGNKGLEPRSEPEEELGLE